MPSRNNKTTTGSGCGRTYTAPPPFNPSVRKGIRCVPHCRKIKARNCSKIWFIGNREQTKQTANKIAAKKYPKHRKTHPGRDIGMAEKPVPHILPPAHFPHGCWLFGACCFSFYLKLVVECGSVFSYFKNNLPALRFLFFFYFLFLLKSIIIDVRDCLARNRNGLSTSWPTTMRLCRVLVLLP